MERWDELERAGYIFEPIKDGGMAILDTDESGTKTEVARFNQDGSMAIKELGSDFKIVHDNETLMLSAEQAQDIRFNLIPNKDGDGLNIVMEAQKDREFVKVAKYMDSENRWTDINVTAEIPGMTETYLNQFIAMEEGTKTIDGKEIPVVYGIKEDGIKLIIVMEIDGTMTRIGEYIHSDGKSYYCYIRTGNDADGRIQVTQNTPKILIARLFENLAKGEKNKVSGGDSDKLYNDVMANGGKIMFKTPTSDDPGNNVSIKVDPWAGWYARWKDLPYEINLNLPMEIIFVNSPEQYKSMPSDVRENAIFWINPDDNTHLGEIVWASETGNLQIWVIHENGNGFNGYLEKHPESTERYVQKVVSENFGVSTLGSLEELKWYSKGRNAFTNNNQGRQHLINLARELFEYIDTRVK